MNFKRQLFLHLLGVPIKEPYGFMFDNLLEFLRPDEPNRLVRIIDLDGDDDICLVDKDGKVIYALYRPPHYMGSIIMNHHYAVSMKTLVNIKSGVVDEMAIIVLKHYKTEFKDFYEKPLSQSFNHRHFTDIEEKYALGDFRLLEF